MFKTVVKMVLGFTKTMLVDGKRKPTHFEDKIKSGVKLHTIRWDEKKRWKQGNKIHFATGVRSSRYNCFKEAKCTGVQDIEIKDRCVWIDGKLLEQFELVDLAINDGFDDLKDFWKWFDEYSPFQGRLIHWTDIRY